MSAPLGPVLVGIDGLELSAESREMLNHPLVGGVVLFTRNFESAAQVRALVQSIHDCRSSRLLLAVDQEGGRVQRFRDGFTRLPPLGRLGALADSEPEDALEYSFRHGWLMAAEMLDLGIDLSFAPVLDLDRGSDVIGDRAFSADSEVVVRLGQAYLDGMHAAGMKTTGKHFPGHGSVQADSHIADVCDERSLDEIEQSDMQPFTRLAPKLDALMIAHVVYPCVDDQPAGYSSPWLKHCLRERLGYDGVIFSDDLGMHAARALGNLQQRTRVALNAGCDSVLVCQPDEVAELLGSDLQASEFRDVNNALQALYGKPTETEPEGERARWRERLEDLN